MDFWNDPSCLNSLSNYIQWAAIALVFLGGTLQLVLYYRRQVGVLGFIVLVFLGGALQLVKYTVDSREKVLNAALETKRQKEISALKSEAAELRAKAADLQSKTERLDPLRQPIRAVSATVEVTIASAENINDHYMGSGNYLAFKKKLGTLLIVSSVDCFEIQQGNNQVLHRSTLRLDETSPAMGKPIGFLKQAEYLQIAFAPMKTKQKVLSGRAVVIINNAVQLNFVVPAQDMDKNLIFVRNIKSPLSVLK